MEETDRNDELDDTLLNLKKRYEEVLAKVKNPKKTTARLFDNAVVPLKMRPSIIDRALQKKTNALPSSTPMVSNKKTIFTPEDSLAVSPIRQNSSENNRLEAAAVLEDNNNSNRNEASKAIQNNNTIITISSTSETLLQSFKTSIKQERNSIPNVRNSQSSASMRSKKAANLEGVIAKLIQPPADKTVQTSRKSLDVVKKMARNICTQTTVEKPETPREIQQAPREIQTQTGDSLNRKVSESLSSGTSEMSDVVERIDRGGMTPKPNSVIPPSYSDEEQKRGGGRSDALPWRPPSGLHSLPSAEFADGKLPEDEESCLDDTFVPAKPQTKKVFINKRKTTANGRISPRSSCSSKENKNPAVRAVVNNGAVKEVVENTRTTRSSAKKLRDAATGTSGLEESTRCTNLKDQRSKSGRRAQKKTSDHLEESAEANKRAHEVTANKNKHLREPTIVSVGVQVRESVDEIDQQSSSDVQEAMEEVPFQECTFDVKIPEEPVFEKQRREEAIVKDGAANKNGQSARKKKNGTMSTVLTKKTRCVDHDFEEATTVNTLKNAKRKSPKIAKKTVAEDSASGGEDSVDAHLQVESTRKETRVKKQEVSRKDRSRAEKLTQEVPTITTSFKEIDKKTVDENLASEGEREIIPKKQEVSRKDRSRRARVQKDVTIRSGEALSEIAADDMIDDVFMEEVAKNNEEVSLSNHSKTLQKDTNRKTKSSQKVPVVILSDLTIEQRGTVTEVAGTSDVGVSAKKNSRRRLEWPNEDSTPAKTQTLAKKTKRSTVKGKTQKATPEVSTDLMNETTLRRSTRERRPTAPRAYKYFQCIESAEKKKLFSSSSSSLSNITRRPSISATFPPTLEEIPEEDDPQPGPSQVKRSVISGRVSKRQNLNKKTKKTVEVLSSNLDEQHFLEFYVDNELQRIGWLCKEPKYEPFEEVPGVSMAVTVSVSALGQSSGFFRIEPRRMKPKLTTDTTMTFVVLQGRGEVGVSDQCDLLTVNTNFVIPKGSEYYIKNLNRTKPLILYFTRTTGL